MLVGDEAVTYGSLAGDEGLASMLFCGVRLLLCAIIFL